MKPVLFSTLLLGFAASAGAEIITSNTSGSAATVGSGFYLAQSVTTPTSGYWDDITFNFVNASGNAPFALGGLYLLSEAYAGLPGDLSSSTPGYVAYTNTIGSGAWEFTGVILQPGTQYFLYTDTEFNGPEILYSTSNPYAGGEAYEATNSTSDYVGVGSIDTQFALTGDAAPEPGTLGLFVGAAGMAAVFFRRRNAETFFDI